jgi:hypothetical protein
MGTDGWLPPVQLALALLAGLGLSVAWSVLADLDFAQLLGALCVTLPLSLLVAAFIDRRHWPIDELLVWVTAESMREWKEKTGSRQPLARRQIEPWLGSPAAASAPPAFRAAALAAAFRFQEARAELSQIDDRAPPAELADREGVRAQADFLEHGRYDAAPWRQAIVALPHEQARHHIGLMAVFDGARAMEAGGDWETPLLAAHSQLRPLRIPLSLAWATWIPRLFWAFGALVALGAVVVVGAILGFDVSPFG